MDLQIRINGICPGGGHITITPIVDGVEKAKRVFGRDDFIEAVHNVDMDDTLKLLIGLFVREYGLNNPSATQAQIRTALQQKVFKI